MPELPEVETVRRGLAPVMEGAIIQTVDLRRPDLRFPFPADFAARLIGRRIDGLGRRAKYLVADLDDGAVLLMHLGMSGSFRIERADDTASPGVFHRARSRDIAHDHVTFHLSGGVDVVYNDPRRFGFMALTDREHLPDHPLMRHLGREPTGNDLDAAFLAGAFRGKGTSLKAALLDQTLVAGLGNIYVCEALWRARLSPNRTAGTLVRKDGRATERLDRLAVAIRAVIADAIAAGGSSLRDYMQADGALGYFQHRFAVYDREGDPCPREDCSGVVRRIVQSGRSTFHCPVCQK
ncbi:bifunctional DNA-formamidopyrimidine glycosylase/DNA-(apurinic or apyrimidinic site) lyase [Chthonobacter albigriseus]|uniref:bifunctional DNA-formamidopyrimidine glycosylase/DNA-(apurinic or apyrimidinic site) lyase n=1 Tax=Chthonobacter albigriseus TaxID=1683161 RepID=UPI0015EECA86|nr:bifunctional DNA-formamidopyrimidine glycosylase/DNA-(apurinic or apyrimidinic site) lyase [Chthonobacter albigriseus]